MLAYGEAVSILKYFQDQSTKNPSFFYAIQLDSEEKITNIFWADARMILDYGQFGDGDAVTFDTTYRINGESRSFAVFSGFNHYRETVIFGAALMYDETADSFTWLFETFLEAMSNKHPQTIFSDQDAAIAKAISGVMPNTHHRLCIWHMMQNALKHMNSIFKGPNGVRNVLGKFIYDYEEEEEFISAWDTMLDTYDVRSNNWLRSIFSLREKWGRPYVRKVWSAGMSSTQLSESLNAELKRCLKSDLNLVEFLNQFERVLNDKRYKEAEAEYDLSFRLPKVKVGAAMLIQAGDFYTKNIFEDFQKEYVESLNLRAEIRYNGEGFTTYHVEHYANETYKKRSVTRDSENNVSCCCRLFEMRGILCSHVIKVLTSKLDVMRIPSQYILKRWTRNARAETIKDVHGNDIQIDPKLEQTTRYRSLCSILRTISCRASETQKTYELVVEEATNVTNF